MEIKTESEFIKSTKLQDSFTESGAEYVLPDYNGDVRKILFTSAQVRPSGKFAGGEEVEFSGIVVYTVVYSDAENNISETSFTSDYDFSVKCNADSYIDAFADVKVSNYAIRLVGPRKISAKANIAASVRLSERDKHSVSGSAFSGEEKPELLTRSLDIRSTSVSETHEREYAELLARLDGAIADEVSVIYTEASAYAESVEPGEDSVTVRGNLRICGVIKNGDEPAYQVERIVPIEETVRFAGVKGDMQFVPEITVTSEKADVNADESGSEVVMSVIAEFSVLGERNSGLDVMTDAYMRSCECDNVYRDFGYNALVQCIWDVENHTAEIERGDMESEHLREVVFLTASPRLDGVEREGDSLKISGEVKYNGVASELNDDGTTSYSSLKFSAPFTKNANINCHKDDILRFEARARARSANASIDANKVYLSSSLELCVTVSADRCERVLTSCDAKEERFSLTPGRVVVYYPDSADTLFSVAKRFHTTPTKVALDNALTTEVSLGTGDMSDVALEGVKKLLIS